MAVRSQFGTSLVRSWARKNLLPSATVIDVGCGSGAPISKTLVDEGFEVFGIDASPTMVSAFRRRFPDAPVACEAAQDSLFFDRTFDGAVAIGLLFLLSEENQKKVIENIAAALNGEGHFLFSAPLQQGEWQDVLTDRRSISLGEEGYVCALQAAGLRLVECCVDEGENNYYDAVKPFA